MSSPASDLAVEQLENDTPAAAAPEPSSATEDASEDAIETLASASAPAPSVAGLDDNAPAAAPEQAAAPESSAVTEDAPEDTSLEKEDPPPTRPRPADLDIVPLAKQPTTDDGAVTKITAGTDAPAAATKKTILFVRHAESTWNAGKKFGHVDHPLTGTGFKQAQELQDALQSSSQLRARFGDAPSVWCSPSTRAVQTANIGLLPLLESGDARLSVTPTARERKKLGWDNIGGARGQAVVERARKHSAKVAPEGSGRLLKRMNTVDLELPHKKRWWSRTLFESKERTKARVDKLLGELAASDKETIVVVTHSNFLRILFKKCLATKKALPEATSAALAHRLGKEKIPNCAVVACELAVPSSSTPPALGTKVRQEGDGGPTLGSPVFCWPAEWQPRQRGSKRSSAKVLPFVHPAVPHRNGGQPNEVVPLAPYLHEDCRSDIVALCRG